MYLILVNNLVFVYSVLLKIIDDVIFWNNV